MITSVSHQKLNMLILTLVITTVLSFSKAETPYYNDLYRPYLSVPEAVYTKEQSLDLIAESLITYYKTMFNLDTSVTDEAILQYIALSNQAYLVNYQYYNDWVYSDCVEYPNNPACQYDEWDYQDQGIDTNIWDTHQNTMPQGYTPYVPYSTMPNTP